MNGLLDINKRGFIHLDLKPANILINKGIPKIADFGFCLEIKSLANQNPKINLNIGTPLYMAPETLLSNQYPLGVLYFELLHGK